MKTFQHNRKKHPSRRHFLHGMALGTAGLLAGCATVRNNPVPETNESILLYQFIAQMPKAELHVHIEGTVNPSDAMRIAARNGSPMPYSSVETFEAALNFNSLESFLKGFHDTIAVLQTEEDFYEITLNYLSRCHAQNVLHVDLKFDPQAHVRRGIAFEAVLNGIHQAKLDAQSSLGISCNLIMCFQRDAPLDSAGRAYHNALAHPDKITGIGLDNTEVLNFPAKFQDLFNRARSDGFKLTSHCDLNQPNSVEHIRACIEDLGVDRLDHGYNVLEDQRLVDAALAADLCFTACPTSAFNTVDHATRYYFTEVSKAISQMLNAGLKVTLNTDDPGVMGDRHLTEVIQDCARHIGLNRAQLVTLSRNAFEGLWVPAEQKQNHLLALTEFDAAWT